MAKRRKVVDKRMIKIQADAYYQALKKFSEETELKEMGKEKEKTSFMYNFLFMLNVFLCPWVISKKFKINNKIYDSILVIMITMLFMLSGTLLWGVGICMSAVELLKIAQADGSMILTNMATGMLNVMLGSVLIISGNEFSKVKDSHKIYAYSASVLAAVSCILATISLLK